MSGRRASFDDETSARPDPLGYARVVLRRCPTLHWRDAAGPQRYEVRARATVGAGGGTEIVVADPAVSRLHAEFDLRDDGLWVRDLGSRNGTFVQGVKVTGACVPADGRVQLGGVTIAVTYAAAPTSVSVWPDEVFGPLRGRSPVMRELFAQLARVAATDGTVLVEGETGTGKELVARAIHEASPRGEAPFIVVDCAALPEQLLEAELFGHARGAFTGAGEHRAGALEAAHGGTVFLDEIGELPLAMQPKLLRAIESRQVRRLGEAQHRTVDVRFVSATHRDLREMVNQGTFREDLYFRLAVLPVRVPPLRARREDVPVLAQHFVPDGAAIALDSGTLSELAGWPWPGNVRELRNFVERALALGPDAALALGAVPSPSASVATTARTDLPLREARERWVEQLEREYVRELLARHGHNVTAAAAAAGVARTYMHRLIRKLER